MSLLGCFEVHRQGYIADQQYPGGVIPKEVWNVGQYTPTKWPCLEDCQDDCFDTDTGIWMPVPVDVDEGDYWGIVTGQVWVHGKVGENQPNYVLRVVKDNNLNHTRIAAIASRTAFPDNWVIPVCLQFKVKPGNTFDFRLFATHADARIDCNKWHTRLSGSVTGPL